MTKGLLEGGGGGGGGEAGTGVGGNKLRPPISKATERSMSLEDSGGGHLEHRYVSHSPGQVALPLDKLGGTLSGSISPREAAGPLHHPAPSTGGIAASLGSLSSVLAAELLYCTVSAGTILFNKHALSTFGFPAPNTLLLFQFTLAVGLLKLLQLLGAIHLEPLRWQQLQLWAPLNLIFVAMNVTSFLALQAIGAGMFTVLKNLSNVLTIGGDWYFNGLTHSWLAFRAQGQLEGLIVLTTIY